MHVFALIPLISLALASPHPNIVRRAGEASIHDAFVKAGKKYFGVCTEQSELTVSSLEASIRSNFGQVTPINSGKWDATEPSKGNFKFNQLDYLVDWAVKNNKLIRGHTTVWYSQLPSWVSQIKDKETLTSVMKNHITTVIGRYKGKIYAWDVVNEIYEENGSFRRSVFYTLLGEDFVKIAFEAARAADPATKLYINDYNTVEKGVNYAKTQGFIRDVKKWVAAGVPIDGVGVQAHLVKGESGNVPAALKALCAIAPECALTELDIGGAGASEYTTTVKACMDIQNCIGITEWGISDNHSWRSSTSPTLLDSSLNAKPAYTALLQLAATYTKSS